MRSFWTVPRMWEGKTVAVLASGPSMSDKVAEQVRAAGLVTIVVNNTYKLAPWADMLYAADHQWWDVHRDAADFAGLKVTASPLKEMASRPWVHVLNNTGTTGFDPDPSAVRTGGNGGYQAIHVAAHAGAKRVLLCGMDMRGGHWHHAHDLPLKESMREHYENFALRFTALKPELDKRGVEVINCTYGSAVKDFEFMVLEDALELT